MELELKKECLDTYELGEPQTLTQEEIGRASCRERV